VPVVSVIDYGLDGRYDGIVAEARSVLDAIPVQEREPTGSRLSPYLCKTFKQSGLSSYMVPARFGGRS
jgi:hypothetical protein